MKGTTRDILISGLLLTIASAPPLILMAREVVISAAVNARYSIEIIRASENTMAGALRAEIGSHRVELVDDKPFAVHQPFQADQDLSERGQVRVLIDGRVHSTVPATIRLMKQDDNRYWGFVHLFKLGEIPGPERLVVAQNLGGTRYRTTSVFSDGRIVDDEFTYNSRCTPPVRALLIRSVVSHPSGFCSDVASVLPTLWYPLLYPFASGLVGFVCIVIGVKRRSPRGLERELRGSL